MNHLTARRRGVNPLHRPPPSIPDLSGLGNVQDCYFDYMRADSSVRVEIYELLADPYIVSYISTGYSDRSPELVSQVFMAAGQVEPTE
jgi:hypothetical protein